LGQVLVLGGHGLDAIVISTCITLHHLTLIAANDTEFADFLMLRVVLLRHLYLTTVVGALNRGVVALSLMFLEIAVGYDSRAALLRILA